MMFLRVSKLPNIKLSKRRSKLHIFNVQKVPENVKRKG